MRTSQPRVSPNLRTADSFLRIAASAVMVARDALARDLGDEDAERLVERMLAGQIIIARARLSGREAHPEQ